MPAPIEAPQTISDDISRREDSVWDEDPSWNYDDCPDVDNEFDSNYDGMVDHSDYEYEDADDFFEGADEFAGDGEEWPVEDPELTEEEKLLEILPSHLIQKWEL